MRTELLKLQGRGLCIVISDIGSILDRVSDMNKTVLSPFRDIHKIAEEMRRSKIYAIKEVRNQTGWGLRESKEYLDKYYFPANHVGENNNASEQFLKDHLLPDFLDQDEMEI